MFGRKKRQSERQVALSDGDRPQPPESPRDILVTEIFATSGIPPKSFIDRDWHDDIRRLKSALAQPGVVPCVWGESKAGKTSFLRKQLSITNKPYVVVPGPQVHSVEDFWRVLGERLKLELSREIQRTTTDSAGAGAKAAVTGEVSGGLAKVSSAVEAQFSVQSIVATSFRTEPLTSARSKCAEFLEATRTTVVLDDVHLVTEAVRREIAFDIRDLSETETSKFVLCAIEAETFDFVDADEQLQKRFRKRPFPDWTVEDLVKVAEAGFGLLGLKITPGQIKLIAHAAQLNPYNLQDICLHICSNGGIHSTADVAPQRAVPSKVLEQALKDFAEDLSYFHEILAKAAEGSANLATYQVGPASLNLFELTLLGLCDSGGGAVTNVSTVRRKIRARVEDPNWNNAHLKMALQRLSETELDVKYQKRSSNRGTQVLRYDDTAEKILITNPLFKVYLVWCLPTKLGLPARSLDHLSQNELEA